MKTHVTCILLALAALLLAASSALGYSCGVPDRTVWFGPHRMINEIAFKAWLANEGKDEKRAKLLKSLNMGSKKMPLLTGIAVKERGAEKITEGYENGTFDWWIVEGGFTADQPEVYNSFRHFYDPLKADGVYHLTDHLKELDWTLRAIIFAITKSPYAAYKMPSPNPRIDARDWAINGTQMDGMWPNAYNWNKGLEYMSQAFASKGDDKQKLFVKSWRALGETMHLMSDMCCPPHVRNDSHPGHALGDYLKIVGSRDVNVGMLKNDPYELLAQTELVGPASKVGIVPNAKTIVDKAEDIMTIFDKVAGYTNHRFITSDTISGTYKGEEYHNVNGRPDYDFPKLDKFKYDEKTGYFTMDFDGRPVRMLHLTWLGENGWGGVEDRMAISSECVKDQAGVLVPIAAYANAKLIDWYVPRVEVKLEEYDPATKTIKGQILHTPYGAQTKPLLYNSVPDDKVELYINDLSQAVSSYTVTVENGKLLLDLSKVDSRIYYNMRKVALEMSIGGLMLRSDDFCFLKLTPEEIPAAQAKSDYRFFGWANPAPESVKKVSYKWDFGDGTKTMDYPYEKPLNEPFSINVKHKWEKEGKYTVTLEVADVTGGLWRTMYEAKSTVWVLRPVSDQEIADAAVAYVKNKWIPKSLPSNVKVTGISAMKGAINRMTSDDSQPWLDEPAPATPAAPSTGPATGKVYLRPASSFGSIGVSVSGKETVNGEERDWSTIVNVGVGVYKFGGEIESGEAVSAGGLGDAY